LRKESSYKRGIYSSRDMKRVIATQFHLFVFGYLAIKLQQIAIYYFHLM
jgi:hypothetical protein